MSGGSHLQVELRSPKRSLDGGYGFNLTKYCASCWSRLGRILKRGARCGICGRRVCKGCRHFVSAKEWICILCYKKRYAPEDCWHDDANTKNFKGSQGKSGTYLLRLTDWSAHGVLEVHKVNDFPVGRIQSFANPAFSVDYPPKSKIYRKNLKSDSKVKSYCLAKPQFNYPLVQRDIQLKNWKTLDDTMNPKKDDNGKYTSANLKQKRREMREHRFWTLGRGRPPDGTSAGCPRRSSSNRISSPKREYIRCGKTLYNDYAGSLSSSHRKMRSNISSSSNASWHREHRRSRRNGDNLFQSVVLHRNEPQIRLSERGTRIFGRRKSYRACPTLKGDVHINGTLIKSKSTSLPCELSQVESHDYEFWNSGFVQSRVRKLEEELAAKYEDKFICSQDYEVQSLCSLQLDKILPDGDDYRIAYLSSTSQESSLDYMDDNYCTIGMGTLDVKLGKKCAVTGNEDWDLTFSSEENDSSSDDDEFFYRKYTCAQSKLPIVTPGYYSRNVYYPNEWDNDISHTSKNGKKHSIIFGDDSSNDSKSIVQQIHESVDRIFHDVMQDDFDVPEPIQDKTNAITLEYSSYSSNDKIAQNIFEMKKESVIEDDLSSNSYNSDQHESLNSVRIEDPCNTQHFLSKCKLPNRHVHTENQLISVAEAFIENLYENIQSDKCNSLDTTNSVAVEKQTLDDKLHNSVSTDYPATAYENALNNSQSGNMNNEKRDVISKCLIFDNESVFSKNGSVIRTNELNANILQTEPENILLKHDLDNYAKENDLNLKSVSEDLDSDLSMPDIAKNENIEISSYHCRKSSIETSDNFQIDNTPDHDASEGSKNYILPFQSDQLSKKVRNIDKRFECKLKRKRSMKKDKTLFLPQTKPILEVQFDLYEPLSTPFSEIYFITYGKRYPKTFYCKLSVPRKILRDVRGEIIAKLFQLHSQPFNYLPSSKKNNFLSRSCDNNRSTNIKELDQTHIFIGNFTNKCYKDNAIAKHSNSFENYGQNSQNILTSNFDHSSFLKSIFPQTEIYADEFNNIFSRNNTFLVSSIKQIFFPSIAIKDVISEINELFTGIHNNSIFLHDHNQYENNILICQKSKSLKSEAIKSMKLLNCLIRENFLKFLNRNTHFLSVPERVYDLSRILDNILFLDQNAGIVIDITRLLVFLLSFFRTIENANLELLNKLEQCNTTYICENVNTFYEKFLISNDINDFLFSISNFALNVLQFYEIRKDNEIKALIPHSSLIGIRQQRTRNRNYGISNYYSRETKFTNEVPRAGETSESRFAIESLPKLTTSLTGNATFVEYLFLQQLESVRATSEAHLSFPPIQLFQSVPAVQRRLVSRESRFSLTGIDHKHGSFFTDNASLAASSVNEACVCDSWDICACGSLTGNYPVKFSSCKTVGITNRNHDFEDDEYLGSVPKGLRQLICDQVIVDDTNCNNTHPASLLSSELHHNMASCEEDPRLCSKVTRTPGKHISKLRKLFDTSESGSSESDTSCLQKDENNPLSSQPVSVRNTRDVSQAKENKPEASKCNGQKESENCISTVCDSSDYDKNDKLVDRLQQKVSSDIPYCRKASSGGDLWKNVDIGVKSSSEGLWSAENSDNDNSHSLSESRNNSFVSSTAELHNLIATSRAELSKKEEPLLSDKSTLENYFTSFENNKSQKIVPSNSVDQTYLCDDALDFSLPENDTFQTTVTYDCGVDELNFDDEDATMSDTSSDEEMRCNPPLNNTHYLPAYSLHTIIEESCEESERDSRNPTPTNEPVTSKLERYFSWDIINDKDTNQKKKDEDESTVYSDSLSENSGSLNGDASKEIDPSHLASSRLEKYFTSGLVGNENYFYPDDAEFLDDAPVSDFEEDSIHQKISRSALLNSLESIADQQASKAKELSSSDDKELENSEKDLCQNTEHAFDAIVVSSPDSKNPENIEETTDLPSENEENEIPVAVIDEENKCEAELISENPITNCAPDLPSDYTKLSSEGNLDQFSNKNVESDLIENGVNGEDSLTQKSTVNKEQLAVDVQAIIRKLLTYFSGSKSKSYKNNVETDYISAWRILETEIERLIQSMSPASSLENNSCNSSTIDSNNSDYGSDTIESLECMTDEDESADCKNRGNAKYPIVDLFNSTYKKQPEFHSFNISDETLSIWKRLIQSLQKDSFCMNDKLCDPNTEARLYIRDQIVNLMHTVTVNESKSDKLNPQVLPIKDKEIVPSLAEENNVSEDINEAFNVSVTGSGLLTYTPDEEVVTRSKTESSDDGISVEGSENFKTSRNVLIDENKPLSSSDSEEELNSEVQKSLIVMSTELDLSDKESLHKNSVTLEKISVDEVDIKLNTNSTKSNDNSTNFSVCVNIDLDEEVSKKTQQMHETALKMEDLDIEVDETIKRSSLHLWVSGENKNEEKDKISDQVNTMLPPEKDDTLYVDSSSHLPCTAETSDSANVPNETSSKKSHRDTGYYSFKSSDDSILRDTPPPDEFMDVPNFKSLKRSVKKFSLTNTLSKSTTNINQSLSVSDTKFSTLQLKNQKSKAPSSSTNSPSRQFTSLFSPTAVFKKLTGSKGNNDPQVSESPIPAKYLKKYARSSSVESENMVGAISMPQLNFPKPGDSYSALGLYSENDRASSLIADDEGENRRYSTYSHSVLTLGAHSASMTSVYSAAACHYGYVTVSGDVLFGLNYNQKSQMMEVFVKQCRNLAAVDIRRNKSDPYVKVYLLPDKTKGGKRKTKTKKSTLNPVFNELLRFPVLKHELESRTLWLSVWNSDLFGRNDFLGEVTLPLGYRLLDSPTLRWYPLQERMESLTSPLNYRGELFLALKYVPRDLSLESRFRPAPVISLRGALHVLVKEARNISVNGSGGNLDAFCKSYLLPDKNKISKQKTPVVKRSRHPKWYYTMIYEDMSVDELKERSLELTVWDHDKITSNEFMGGIRLNLGTGLYHGVSVEWMDARRDEASLWQAMLESPNMWVDGCLPLRPTMQFHHG